MKKYELAWDNSFKRSFKRLTKNNNDLKSKIIETLELLQENPYNPKLKTHKLQGKLKNLFASIVEYDCRIIFTFTVNPENNDQVIALIDIGTHDNVY